MTRNQRKQKAKRRDTMLREAQLSCFFVANDKRLAQLKADKDYKDSQWCGRRLGTAPIVREMAGYSRAGKLFASVDNREPPKRKLTLDNLSGKLIEKKRPYYG